MSESFLDDEDLKFGGTAWKSLKNNELYQSYRLQEAMEKWSIGMVKKLFGRPYLFSIEESSQGHIRKNCLCMDQI